MMNAEFREWDFLKMEYFLRSKEDFYQHWPFVFLLKIVFK